MKKILLVLGAVVVAVLFGLWVAGKFWPGNEGSATGDQKPVVEQKPPPKVEKPQPKPKPQATRLAQQKPAPAVEPRKEPVKKILPQNRYMVQDDGSAKRCVHGILIDTKGNESCYEPPAPTPAPIVAAKEPRVSMDEPPIVCRSTETPMVDPKERKWRCVSLEPVVAPIPVVTDPCAPYYGRTDVTCGQNADGEYILLRKNASSSSSGSGWSPGKVVGAVILGIGTLVAIDRYDQRRHSGRKYSSSSAPVNPAPAQGPVDPAPRR